MLFPSGAIAQMIRQARNSTAAGCSGVNMEMLKELAKNPMMMTKMQNTFEKLVNDAASLKLTP